MQSVPVKMLRVYPDTCLLKGYVEENKLEKKAMKKLRRTDRAKILIEWESSRRVLDEIRGAKSNRTRRRLKKHYEEMALLAKDHQVQGFHPNIDAMGGCTANPMVADVSDTSILSRLQSIGLGVKDAKNLTVAIHNQCDVFLTRDVRTILKFRTEIERSFAIKLRTASELLREIDSGQW